MYRVNFSHKREGMAFKATKLSKITFIYQSIIQSMTMKAGNVLISYMDVVIDIERTIASQILLLFLWVPFTA